MVIIILPAFNEAEGIGELIEHIEASLSAIEYHVVVVNDGSADDTGKIVTEMSELYPVTLLAHEENKGAGQAIATGIEHACVQFDTDDYVVTMDADNTQSPDLILTMLDAASSGADIVIASRFVEGGGQVGVPWHRSLLSHGARIAFRILFPMKIKDYTSFYRLYRVKLLRDASALFTPLLEVRGFAAILELLIKLRLFRPKITQVPLCLRYDLKAGGSKMKIFETLTEYGILLLRLKLMSMRTPTVKS